MEAREFIEKRYGNLSDDSTLTVQACISLMEGYSKTTNVCAHEMKPVRDKRYPYVPLRCTKCGYEP